MCQRRRKLDDVQSNRTARLWIVDVEKRRPEIPGDLYSVSEAVHLLKLRRVPDTPCAHPDEHEALGHILSKAPSDSSQRAGLHDCHTQWRHAVHLRAVGLRSLRPFTVTVRFF